MSRFPVAVPRSARQPQVASLGDAIHVMSDTHFEIPEVSYPQANLGIVAADLNHMVGRSTVLAWGHAGDHTSLSETDAMDAFKAWWLALDRNGKPTVIIPGNHELETITPDEWVTAYSSVGAAAKNYAVDVGSNLRVLCLSSVDEMVLPYRNTLDQARLEWCDARMDETDRACVILYHAPLQDTVNADPADNAYLASDNPDWYAHISGAYTAQAMIAKHPNFRAWISGHIHNPPITPQIVKAITYGAVTFAAISVSSPHPIPATARTIASCHITVLPDRIEVRYRDHGAAQWLSPVHTVML